MEDKGACLMTSSKAELVGFWRGRRVKDNLIIANDRSLIYAYYLIVSIFPLGEEFGMPSLLDFTSSLEKCKFFDDFCLMYGYYMFLCYGSVMNLSVRFD